MPSSLRKINLLYTLNMKFLLVDNYNDKNKIKNLENFLLKYGSVDTVNFAKLYPPFFDVFKYDCVVLSGSSIIPIMYNDEMFLEEIDLIKEINIPIIGICFGFELLAYAYGNKLEPLKNKIHGIHNVDYMNAENQTHTYKVWENHNWILKSVKNFDVLGKSKFGIEVLEHKSKKFYGLQFHPEYPENQNFGYLIFNDILKRIRS